MFGLVPFAKNLTKGNNDLGNLFDVFDEPFFQNVFAPVNQAIKSFKVDVKDKGDAYELTADLPGVKKENISVDYNKGYLTVKTTEEKVSEAPKAEAKDAKETKEEKADKPADKYLRRERYYGSMQRSFYIDNVNKADIKAAYKDGVLTVTLPKATKQQSDTTIEIA